MIYVDRSRVGAPDILTTKGAKGPEETKAAVDFYEKAENAGKPYPDDFEVYGLPEVKVPLIQLFNGKCAYCEAKIASVMDVNVEHYRPKGAIQDGGTVIQPGYYWLAATWENLFPSCIPCNQWRRHEMPSGVVTGGGKGMRFPLKPNTQRATKPGDEQNEHPLLLNPCEHKDLHKHLRFRHDGTVEGITDEGTASVDVYALWRPALVKDREQRAREVEAAAQELLTKWLHYRRCKNPQKRTKLRQELKRIAVRLRPFYQSEAPFVGLTRSLTPEEFWPIR